VDRYSNVYSAFQKQSKLVAIDWLLTRAEEKTTIEEEIELLRKSSSVNLWAWFIAIIDKHTSIAMRTIANSKNFLT